MKPDARTKAWIKDQKMIPWRTENWNYYAKKKYDLLYIADYIGMPRLNSSWRGPILGIQVTGASGRSSHRNDLISKTPKKQMLKRWLSNGWRFELHSWKKKAIHGRGKRKDWKLTREKAILSPTGRVSFEEVIE